MKILIIDDDLTHINLMKSKLEKEGFTDIFEAYNGEDGIDFAKRLKPDIVLVDTVLPGINGNDVCEKLNEMEGLYSKIIVMTGKVDYIDVTKAMSKGADDYCVKTTEYTNLIETVKNVVKKIEGVQTQESPILIEKAIESFKYHIKNKNKNILIIDDVLENRMLTKVVLEQNNYGTLEAVDGLEAIRVLQLHDNIDLIVLDLDMPRMNGFTFCEVVRNDNKYNNIPIIIVTASYSELNAKHLNYNYYMQKPINVDDLLVYVKELI